VLLSSFLCLFGITAAFNVDLLLFYFFSFLFLIFFLLNDHCLFSSFCLCGIFVRFASVLISSGTSTFHENWLTVNSQFWVEGWSFYTKPTFEFIWVLRVVKLWLWFGSFNYILHLGFFSSFSHNSFLLMVLSSLIHSLKGLLVPFNLHIFSLIQSIALFVNCWLECALILTSFYIIVTSGFYFLFIILTFLSSRIKVYAPVSSSRLACALIILGRRLWLESASFYFFLFNYCSLAINPCLVRSDLRDKKHINKSCIFSSHLCSFFLC